MNEIIISNLNENSLRCDLCKGLSTLYVKEIDSENKIVDAWFRCLVCKKDYGAKLHFYKLPDGTIKIKTEIIWKREIKE